MKAIVFSKLVKNSQLFTGSALQQGLKSCISDYFHLTAHFELAQPLGFYYISNHTVSKKVIS